MGSYQVLLLFSINDHVTPKCQNCLRRIGFPLASSNESVIPCHTHYMSCPCLAFVVPHHLVIEMFSEQLLLFIYYGNIITGKGTVSAAQIQFILRFLW